MIRPIALLTAFSLLASCGYVRESRINPFNWFGDSEKTYQKVALPERGNDPRPLMQQITNLVIEPIGSGALVRATGLPPSQGYWDAALVPARDVVDGKLVIDFVAFPPVSPKDQGTPYSREVVAAVHISNIKLNGVREIVVQSANGGLSKRR